MGKKSARLRARVVRRGVAIAVVAIALALTFVWTRVRVVQLGYEVSQINKQVGDLMRQRNRFEVEVAKLKSPDRLEQMARDHFNMRLPVGNEIVFMTMTPETQQEKRHAKRRAEYMAQISQTRERIEQEKEEEKLQKEEEARKKKEAKEQQAQAAKEEKLRERALMAVGADKVGKRNN